MYQPAPATVAWNQGRRPGFTALQGPRTMVQTQTVHLDCFPMAAKTLVAQDGQDLLGEVDVPLGRGGQVFAGMSPVGKDHPQNNRGAHQLSENCFVGPDND